MPAINGATLRVWRRSRGWDVPEMARQLRRAAQRLGTPVATAQASLVQMIYAWERGDHKLTERYQLLYAAALGVDADQLGPGDSGNEAVKALGALTEAAPASGHGDHQVQGNRTRAGIARSDFLVLAGTVIALLDVLKDELPERIAAVSVGRVRMDDETAEGLASVVLGYRQVYRSAAPSSLFDPVCGVIRLLTDLAPAAGRYRDKIVSLIGQASSLAATILMLDQGDFEGATRYMAIATRGARQSGDEELMAISLAVRAFHACYQGDAPDGLAFAVEAQRIAGPGVHPLSRGWVNAVASEMHATTGDQEGFERALSAAQGFLQAPDPGKPWEGIGAFSRGKLTAYEGGGLLRLGMYDAAQKALRKALNQLDKSYLKHRCTAHIDLADACSRNGQVEQAARHGMAALSIVSDTRHAESLRRVGELDAELGPYDTQASRDLHSAYMEARAAT
jgi:tetratricopeptide (TPR) repeat protein